MPRRFKLTRDYTAVCDGRQYGPWPAGQLVELEADESAWIERDSPGALLDLGERRGERVDDDPAAEPARTTDAPATKTASSATSSGSKAGKRS